ncbi:peptidoglycan D,D-transpeptidase FtsI family protein [Ruminococcus gauvreauii]|uniref:Penicillin-binding transpeptidase domain-containing protein n=1 Tax=Ruminococcus gauvreauii TaxID=438033 RepID=A0ABY5VD41_9FIRM|nr:penicillin-binding transpeptidase domain-containing protein [Ruminococcus gauvreauii]UWP58499.1 penicillin-binding transpeptidase domain-containing protein [Ruminococcus gauvreauii]
MRKKLVWSFGAVILALVGLSIRITYINATSGERYKKQVLTQSQQQYDSRVIPFKRGDILDKNGTILATSEKVYNVILDCKVVNSNEKYLEPTIKALVEVLGLDEEMVRAKLTDEETKSSQYQILKKELSITDKKDFEDYCDTEEKEMTKDELTERQNVKGVWFEEDYLRTYPLNSLACDVIGFTYSGNTADWGIEGYYSSTLNGVNGRQYGYFNSDADVEQTIIEPQSGNSVVTTIDVNIQETVEKYIKDLMDGLANGPNGAKGAKNVGVVVANPNTGEILAMGSSDPYDLNNPRDLTPFYAQEEIDKMSNETMLDNLNGIWKNYCISDAYEPGSTVKPMSVAAALESGDISYDDTFYCGGYEVVAGETIKCSVYPGAHETQTLSEVMKNSCNSALMQMAEKMGVEDFIRYQNVFNFGLRTGIDLPGEASGITHTTDTMGQTELATSSFGQGYTCTMIQETAAICSVINGGYYYQPHIVSKVLNSDGAVIKNVEPVLMKQTVSEEVSAHIREYMGAVVASNGTGKYAKVDGYSMGGKTGTAQKIPRGNGKYLISYVGFAPLDDPQVVIYTVVDEPNVEIQSISTYAQYLAHNIMSEILPYMNIFPDEGTDGESADDGISLEEIFDMEGEDRTSEGVSDTSVPEPLEDDEDVEGGNTQTDDGVTNEEAGLEN